MHVSKQKNKVAFITGSNRGIGLQTARELGQLGIEVILGVRDPEDTSAVRTLRAEGITVEAIHYDTAKPETDRAAFAYLERRFGKLDILVNNAGVLQEPLMGKDASTLPEGTLRDTFETNFF